MKPADLEAIANNEIAKGRFDGSLKFEFSGIKPSVRAATNMKTKQTFIQFNPDFELRHPGQSEGAIRDVTRHEINHHGYYGFVGCPQNVDKHAKLFIEPMMDVLKKKGFSIADAQYASNALQDTILHTDLAGKFSLDGIAHFFEDVGFNSNNSATRGNLTKEKKARKKGKPNPMYTEFYEAHVKLNMYLWGNGQQKSEVQRYYRHTDKVKEVLEKFLERTGISKLRNDNHKDAQAIRRYITDENNWKNISKIYAEEFSKLMQPNYAMPLPNDSGEGTKGQEEGSTYGEGDKPSEDPKDGDGGGDPEEGDGGGDGPASKPGSPGKLPAGELPKQGSSNPFDDEMGSEDYKRKRAQEAYYDNKNPPEWLDPYTAMDMVYQMLAKKLNIKVETFTNQGSMPIYHYGKRPFNPTKDNARNTMFGFDDKGKMGLMKKRYHEDMPLEYKVSPKGFPEVRFCLLDTSGSMFESLGGDVGKTSIIPWGDKCKYHYALLGWYGLIEYLKQNHLLKQTSISLANFGNVTVMKQGLEEAKKLALHPQGGGTAIELGNIRRMFRNRDMLIFTISDGDIANWPGIKEEFIREASKHHYFHLQIGSANTVTKDLEQAGLYVEYIQNATDLSTKVIDLTDNLYRNVPNRNYDGAKKK
ncbi:MAG: hypothetical protein V1906_01460 [Candidatus Woesearchaeota archaeon]